eukprot:GFUD01003178.1.p1 GENE.GFUD01003178.1~~GFUD01003178.1.p1  ORF type:complete len:283 (-),score=87.37 GFUD01003178.1:714-1562(-)
MASKLSSQNEGENKTDSIVEFSTMTPTNLPFGTTSISSHSQESYETEWLANNTTNNTEDTYDDSKQDYYVKYEEDSRFRNFVKSLIRSKSNKSLKSSNKDNMEIDQLQKRSSDRSNIPTGNTDIDPSHTDTVPKRDSNKDTNPKSSNKITVPKINDDICTGRGQYQDMVRDRWGEKRRLDTRTGGGRAVEKKPSTKLHEKEAMTKKPEEKPENKNIADVGVDFDMAKSCPYSTLPRERASVVLREKHQSPSKAREDCTRMSGVFTLPRVSCYHRSTRVGVWD